MLYLWQKRLDAQGRYLDYRALAEALRVQFYWRLAGLNDSAAASYLRKQLDELRWIRDALRGGNALPPPAQARAGPGAAPLGARPGPVLPQRAPRSLMARIHRVERTSAVFLAVRSACDHLAGRLLEPLGALGHTHHWLVLIMGFAPIAAALWEAYGERFGLRSQAHQYSRFAAIFDRAETAIARLEASPAAPDRGSERAGTDPRARPRGAHGERRLGAAAAGSADRAAEGLSAEASRPSSSRSIATSAAIAMCSAGSMSGANSDE